MVLRRKNIPHWTGERGETLQPVIQSRFLIGGGTFPAAQNPGAFVYERGGFLTFFTENVNIFRH
jgi:hypothetical protein